MSLGGVGHVELIEGFFWLTVGAVLNQEAKPIAYFSEKLNEARKKYSSYDKEFYVVVQSLNKWRHYLLHKKFVLYSDNHALQYIMQQPN